ncbi:YcnI family protein [Streptomyces oceani]|uniref:YncI copper-binding domain-containing protein n=1 Tax=Streptomyces oceani TaxID=1075402 RepID=A0A1E7JWN3_9ACTN|nr:YcnI family protein [Streptomyces oceani]OEU96043.1 hypothetical protein AN216_21975 [Streptomyces oceani]
MKPSFTTCPRLPVAGAIAAATVLLGAGTASAHVSVDPEKAPQGDYDTVAFKVPNERDDAATVQLEVHFPTDQPMASVMPEPVPGWDVKVTKSKLDKPLEAHGQRLSEAVSKITWTGGEIDPGQFQRFPVSLGELPKDSERMVFKALQTYENDEVVRWIEEPREGEAEPEHPAPVLQLTANDPTGGTDDAASGEQADSAVTAATDDEPAEQGGTDSTARVLGVIGILTGVGGIAYGVLAGRRRAG